MIYLILIGCCRIFRVTGINLLQGSFKSETNIRIASSKAFSWAAKVFYLTQELVILVQYLFGLEKKRPYRSSRQRCFIKKVVLKKFAIFTGKYLCRSIFFNKVAGLWACNFIKKRLQHRCFPVNIVKFLRAPILRTAVSGIRATSNETRHCLFKINNKNTKVTWFQCFFFCCYW